MVIKMQTLNSAKYVTHLMANTANGVSIINPFDYPEMELTDFRDFIRELPRLSDDETIFTAVNPDELDELKQDYTVNHE